MDDYKVIISRYWNNPKINYLVTDKEITMVTQLNDFITALATEVGNPTLLITKAQLEAKLKLASAAVCEKIKEVTKN